MRADFRGLYSTRSREWGKISFDELQERRCLFTTIGVLVALQEDFDGREHNFLRIAVVGKGGGFQEGQDVGRDGNIGRFHADMMAYHQGHRVSHNQKTGPIRGDFRQRPRSSPLFVLHDRLLQRRTDPVLQGGGCEDLGPRSPSQDPGLQVRGEPNLQG